MSLINIPTPTPSVLTMEQKQKRVATRIRIKSTNLFNQVRLGYLSLAKDVEENPEGLTREEALAALSEEDRTIFLEIGTSLKAILNQVKPNSIP